MGYRDGRYSFIHLASVLLLLSIGFLLLNAGLADRAIPTMLKTADGVLDISPYIFSEFPNAGIAVGFVAIFVFAHIVLRHMIPGADPLILAIVALLSGIGLIVILRLSPELASSRNDAIISILSRNSDAQVKDNVLALARLGVKQFLFIAAGVAIMLTTAIALNRRTCSWLSRKKYIWIVLSVLLIAATILFGTKKNNRTLWLLGFQTVELVKLMTVMFMAGYVHEMGRGLLMSSRMGYRVWLSYAGPFLAMWCLALVPLLVQKDIGPTFLILMVFIAMFHCAGNRHGVTLLFLGLIGAAGYAAYVLGYPPPVRERFDMFLEPFSRSESMSRVLWTIASGGIFGAGIGYGEPYRIPEVQSDFSFAALCEETGLVGAVSVILLLVVFIIRCFRAGAAAATVYERSLAVGIATLIGMQAFIIISGNLVMVPLTGITLPFVSYGGSATIMNFVMAGIVIRISGEPDEKS